MPIGGAPAASLPRGRVRAAWIVALLASAAAQLDAAIVRCPGQEALRVEAAALFDAAAHHSERWLSPLGWPRPGAALLELANSVDRRSLDALPLSGAASCEVVCHAEAFLVLPLVWAYESLVDMLGSWNLTSIAMGQRVVASAALWQIHGAYGGYLEYHTAKAVVVDRLAASVQPAPDLFGGWPLALGERVVAALLRTAWLALSPHPPAPARAAAGESRSLWLLPSLCNCRPETLSYMFDTFEELRRNLSFGLPLTFGSANCDSELDDHDAAKWLDIGKIILPLQMRCIPVDIVLLASCAEWYRSQGAEARARHYMAAAVNSVALAADCFDHMPYAGVERAFRAAEVFHNWARSTFPGALRPWVPLPTFSPALAEAARPPPRPLCAAELGAVCLHGPGGRFEVFGAGRGPAHPGHLLQCGDSFGDWRRISLLPASAAKARPRPQPRAWVIHFSDLLASNLWHGLHILLPVAARQGAGVPGGVQVVLDGAAGESNLRPGQPINTTLGWRLLVALFGTAPLLVREVAPGDPPVCFGGARWGQPHLALIGGHRGDLRRAEARAAVAAFAAPLLSAATAGVALQRYTSPALVGREALAAARRVLFMSRRASGHRSLQNAAEVLAALRSSAVEGRARLAVVDFSSPAYRGSVARQLQMVSMANVLIGPQGAGLAWSAFLAERSAVVELMTHITWNRRYHCRSPGVDSTPVSYFGSISDLFGHRHFCIVGRPCHPAERDSPSLLHELIDWAERQVCVDVRRMHATLRCVFRTLDEEHAAAA